MSKIYVIICSKIKKRKKKENQQEFIYSNATTFSVIAY